MNTVRTVSDTKQDFYKSFPKPVNSIYRRVIDELLVEVHLLTVNQTFVTDQIFFLGLATAFDRFTVGYHTESDRHAIFSSLCQSVLLNAEHIRYEATQLHELAMRSPSEVKNLLTTLESTANLDPLMGCVRAIAANPNFKYSRLFGIGVFTLLEITDAETIADSDKRQALITQVAETLHLSGDRLVKDLDLYRSNLDKVEQARQMMADLVEAERKKRLRDAAKSKEAETTESNNQGSESTSAEAS